MGFHGSGSFAIARALALNPLTLTPRAFTLFVFVFELLKALIELKGYLGSGCCGAWDSEASLDGSKPKPEA